MRARQWQVNVSWAVTYGSDGSNDLLLLLFMLLVIIDFFLSVAQRHNYKDKVDQGAVGFTSSKWIVLNIGLLQ